MAPTRKRPFDVQAFLESAGIAAVVRGEHLFGLRGFVPMTDETLPSVWIEDDDDLAQALQLLEQLEARSRLRPVDSESDEGGAAEVDWDAGEKQIG